ncbi:MAG: hypothetical protein ABDH23_03125 [Endomicrobiia bacterium]
MAIYKLYLEYNGKNFYGSQIQKNLRTVEKVLRDTLNNVLLNKYKLALASRTDVGVHALCNVAKLHVDTILDVEEFLTKLNYFLPDDLQVTKILKVKKDFDIREVKYKLYQYTIYNSLNKPVLYKDYVWWIKDKISYSTLKKAAKFFSSIKKFNFATAKEVIDKKRNTICRIKIKVRKFQNFIILSFYGDRFIYRLIRNLVSLMVDVATKKIDFKQLYKIVDSWEWFKNKPAPACGLVLTKIVF